MKRFLALVLITAGQIPDGLSLPLILVIIVSVSGVQVYVAIVNFNLREPEQIIRIQDHSCPVLLEIHNPVSSDRDKQPMQVSLLSQALKHPMPIEHLDRFMAINICRN